MKKVLKFFAGVAVVGAAIGGAYYFIKNYVLDDYYDDFDDEFDDDYDDFDDFEDFDNEDDEEVQINLEAVDTADANATEDNSEEE